MNGNPFGVAAPVAQPEFDFGVKKYPKIKAWSYSTVNNFTKCPLSIRFNKIDRIPEPDNEAQARGNAIHADLAHLIRTGEWPERPTIPHRDEWRKRLLHMHVAGARAELQHAFDRQWQTVPWFGVNVYGRVIIDAILDAGDTVILHEHKSGKYWPEHEKQKRLYGLVAMMMYPNAEQSLVQINYIDQPDQATDIARFTREQIPELKAEFDEFALPLLSEEIYPASPGRHCGRCSYAKTAGGPCVHG